MTSTVTTGYDAVLLVAFGGPEGPDEVEPFLARVTAGRDIAPERLVEVGARYLTAGGVSPINGRLRALVPAVTADLADRGYDLPVFWGNRNAPPLLADTVAGMRDAGIRRALAWVASPYSSFSTCRQYREDLDTACASAGPDAPLIDRIRPHHDHPGLIETAADRLREALAVLGNGPGGDAHLLFSAHSIPCNQATTCDYAEQVDEAAGLVAGRADPAGHHSWDVVWQSRSGRPGVPWLEPNIGDRIDALAADGVRAVAVSPIGFPVENFEIAWDLDVEAARRAQAAGVAFSRARAVDNDPRFVKMIGDLVAERIEPQPAQRAALGSLGIRPDTCPGTCCPGPA